MARLLHRIVLPLVTCMVFAGLWAPSADAALKKGALDAFKKSHGTVLQLVKRDAKRAKLEKEVDKLLDYQWIAQAALGGKNRYAKRCESRCADFERLLTELIRRNYLKRIRQSHKGSVSYDGEQRRARVSKVNTTVSFKRDGRDQKLGIAYVMHEINGHWQVRDIITDGVSLARNFSYEFNQVLRKDGIDELIRRLEAKVAENPAD